MKKSCSQLKDAARSRMLGNYSVTIASTILIELVVLLFDIPFSRMLTVGVQYMAVSRIVLGYIGALVVSLISVPFSSGVIFMHLRIARQQDIRFSDMLYGVKNRPDRYLKYGLVIIVLSCLCTLPGTICSIAAVAQAQNDPASAMIPALTGGALSIAGAVIYLILMLSLSLSVFLLLDDPDLPVRSALRQSMRMMRGNKWRLFVLFLSFIGWFLLGLLTLGLGYLWIIQYVAQALTQFYLDIKNQGNAA